MSGYQCYFVLYYQSYQCYRVFAVAESPENQYYTEDSLPLSVRSHHSDSTVDLDMLLSGDRQRHKRGTPYRLYIPEQNVLFAGIYDRFLSVLHMYTGLGVCQQKRMTVFHDLIPDRICPLFQFTNYNDGQLRLEFLLYYRNTSSPFQVNQLQSLKDMYRP